jgi:nitrate reductase molybdenum cofactor assembly chaperone NarJ/NarW
MKEICRLFACLLEYPTSALGAQAGQCGEVLSAAGSPATPAMVRFCGCVEQVPLARMEELYTRTFDLQAVCSPYVGYHLFGDSYQRGLFMARLNEGYRIRGFSAGSELPDHVAIVLRFLEAGAEDEFSETLLREGLLPALDKMSGAFDSPGDNPYREVICALLLALQGGNERGMNDA